MVRGGRLAWSVVGFVGGGRLGRLSTTILLCMTSLWRWYEVEFAFEQEPTLHLSIVSNCRSLAIGLRCQV